MRFQKIEIAGRILVLFVGAILTLNASGLSDLAVQADAVVVGTIATRIEGSSNVTFDIRVQRALSGAGVPATVHISHNWNGGMAGPTATINFALAGIWFLSKGPSGSWDVIPCRGGNLFGSLFFPATAVPPGGTLAYSRSTPLEDSLAFEAVAGTEAVQGSSPQDLLSAIDTTSASTPIVLNALLASPQTSFEAVALAGMLATNQPGTITALARLWPQLVAEPNRSLVVSALRAEWRDVTPGSVAQLSALIGSASTTPDLRSAAIRSLMATHTAASLPLFSQLLFGTDPNERIEAAIAISGYVNGCGGQTPANTASLGHMICNNSTLYKSSDTMANRVFGSGSQTEQAASTAYWQSWWRDHPGVQ